LVSLRSTFERGGTSAVRYLEEGEDAPEDAMVVWSNTEVPPPLRCRVFPENYYVLPHDGMTEDQVRNEFSQLWREE
jgi:hypothetical protein